MAWTDRVVEYPNRVKLTAVSGEDNVYNIEASEGTVYVEGTLLNAANLNNETMNLISGVVADTWNSSKSYAVGDSCIYDNMLWHCLTANTNVEPTEGTYWTRIKLAPADYVVEDVQVDNYRWYRKWASGRVEQGGYGSFSASSGSISQTVTMPVTCIDQNFLVFLQGARNFSQGQILAEANQAGTVTRTNNSFVVTWGKTAHAYGGSYSWYCIGRWK